MKYSLTWLQEQFDANIPLKYIYFWGHRPNKDGSIGKSCMSQWWISAFTVEGISYKTAEHWMMAEKARLFRDDEVLQKILQAPTPAEAKKLGRQVRNFDHAQWSANCYEIVKQGNVHKFGQNEELRGYLLTTGNRILVEASPQDAIWGIGMAENHPDIYFPSKWKGTNLLGFALMEARDVLASV
ncbi:MAG: NADAR family protein [Flammeovirgaceae bacterium]